MPKGAKLLIFLLLHFIEDNSEKFDRKYSKRRAKPYRTERTDHSRKQTVMRSGGDIYTASEHCKIRKRGIGAKQVSFDLAH